VNFSLEKRKRQIPTNTHRRIKESASAEVFEQEWRLVLHCTSIQQHLGDLFSGIAPTLGIDVGAGVQQHLDRSPPSCRPESVRPESSVESVSPEPHPKDCQHVLFPEIENS
jgi:hypothetical protein